MKKNTGWILPSFDAALPSDCRRVADLGISHLEHDLEDETAKCTIYQCHDLMEDWVYGQIMVKFSQWKDCARLVSLADFCA